MAAQIGYYDTLKSVAGKVFAFLASITLTGVDGKTLTINKNITLTAPDDTAVATLPAGSHSLAPLDSPSFTTPALGTPASGNLLNCAIEGPYQALFDDTALSFTLGHTAAVIIIGTSQGATSGIVHVRPDTPTCTALAAGADFNVATGVLNGTTGTDDKLTVSCHTDGKVYIENRKGTIGVNYKMMCTVG